MLPVSKTRAHIVEARLTSASGDVRRRRMQRGVEHLARRMFDDAQMPRGGIFFFFEDSPRTAERLRRDQNESMFNP
jgi:hypothetical protein